MTTFPFLYNVVAWEVGTVVMCVDRSMQKHHRWNGCRNQRDVCQTNGGWDEAGLHKPSCCYVLLVTCCFCLFRLNNLGWVLNPKQTSSHCNGCTEDSVWGYRLRDHWRRMGSEWIQQCSRSCHHWFWLFRENSQWEFFYSCMPSSWKTVTTAYSEAGVQWIASQSFTFMSIQAPGKASRIRQISYSIDCQ